MNIFTTPINCAWPAWQLNVNVENFLAIAEEIHKQQGELLTLWGSDERSQGKGFFLHAIFIIQQKRTLYVNCLLDEKKPSYPDLCGLFPVAVRLQRMIYDLLGFKALHAEDQRPWIRHGAWPSDVFPLRHEIALTDIFPQENDQYSFVRVGGDGVHEIPVGPVHAGIIEAGHFRFHVVGEIILRMETRLAYTHKGIAKHYQGASFQKGAQLAGRISGDSTVAYAFAYAMAVENLCQHSVPIRAQWLRALFLERERIANHLGDLGALGNDAGLSFGLAQFSRLKETMLRLNLAISGHRYLMDVIVPGGVVIDLAQKDIIEIQQEIASLSTEVKQLQHIYTQHCGLQDRFLTTGIITSVLANKLGLLGLSARASGRTIDWRVNMPCAPYSELPVQLITHKGGDVAARVWLRFQEVEESLCLMALILNQLPDGPIQQPLPRQLKSSVGFGCVEGWRGPVFIAMSAQVFDMISWAHTHDPSWQNWPALEHAVMDNIVADFPLINKSFNLSYSGHDG